MKELYVVNCCRTAIGSFGGSLKDVPATELGAIVVKEAARAGDMLDCIEKAGGKTLEEALANAYALAGSVKFDGGFLRRDIAHRELERRAAK